MIRFKCPSCGTAIQVNDEQRGKQAQCPQCSTITRVGSVPPPLPAAQFSQPPALPRSKPSVVDAVRAFYRKPLHAVLTPVAALLAIVAVHGVVRAFGATTETERVKQSEQQARDDAGPQAVEDAARQLVAQKAADEVVRSQSTGRQQTAEQEQAERRQEAGATAKPSQKFEDSQLDAALQLQKAKSDVEYYQGRLNDVNVNIVAGIAAVAIAEALVDKAHREDPGSFREFILVAALETAKAALNEQVQEKSTIERQLRAAQDRYRRLQFGR